MNPSDKQLHKGCSQRQHAFLSLIPISFTACACRQLAKGSTHLILEQLPERLNELELQVLRKTTHIVVALDGVRVLLAATRWWT